jgi:Tol biopolymer transport system component
VVAKAVDAATRSSAELPGDFLLTALTAMASPSPYYELSGVWTPAYTVNVTPLGDITVGEGVTGIDPTFIMNTPMPAVAAGATLPAVWSGVNTAPAVAPSDFVIYPPPNTATLPAGIDAFVRRDKHINFLVKATDAQGDIAYCQWSDSLASGSGPPNGTFSVTGEVEMEWSEADGKYISSVQWTPPPNAVGRDEYTITLTLRDRNGGTTPLSRKVKIMEGRIVFSSNRDGNYDIYVMNADGTDQTQLTSDSTQNYNPVFSPDGAKIAYLVDAGGNWQIVVMNADGTGKTQLATSSDQRSYPLFSPDGTKITYHDMVGGYNQIIVMNADGTGRMQFTAGNDHHELPVFSQNGTKITYYALVGGDYQVFVMNADGTGKTQLTTDSNQNVWPVFSPDGMKIAYHARVGGVGGHNQIFVMNADGTGQTQLTTSSTHHELPVFTPEGTRIIYLAAAGGYWQIFMMNADGTGQTQLTTASSRAYPSFSPDGTKIAFYAEAGGHNQIFVMNADGTGQTQLTSGHDCHLCLRPGIWLR